MLGLINAGLHCILQQWVLGSKNKYLGEMPSPLSDTQRALSKERGAEQGHCGPVWPLSQRQVTKDTVDSSTLKHMCTLINKDWWWWLQSENCCLQLFHFQVCLYVPYHPMPNHRNILYDKILKYFEGKNIFMLTGFAIFIEFVFNKLHWKSKVRYLNQKNFLFWPCCFKNALLGHF